MKNKNLFALIIFMFLCFSCTDLKEEILDASLGEDLLQSADAPQGVLAAAYAHMSGVMNSATSYFALQEVSSDECILPYRGGTDWYDGGRYMELYQHTWTPLHSQIAGGWNNFSVGVGKSLLAMKTIQETPNANPIYLAEARALVAFYSSYLLDMFGVVMEKDPKDVGTNVLSKVLRSNEAFDYIVNQLTTAEPNLSNTATVGSGRFSKEAVWALLARLYLNKPFYINPYVESFSFNNADLDNVIKYCDLVINSGLHLETKDYFNIFNVDNYKHPELIFALDGSLEANGSSRITWFVLSRTTYGSPIYANRDLVGTDGGAITVDFLNLWEGNMDDPRFYTEYLPQKDTVVAVKDYTLNRGMLREQQYGIAPNAAGNDFKKDSKGNLVIEKLIEIRTGKPLVYTKEIDLGTHTSQAAGYRANKYAFDPESNNKGNGRVDIPILRLGDVVLMKAEALLRKGQTTQALDIVNNLRVARKAKPIQSLDIERMYKERSYELYYEQIRRTEMIRYGKYEKQYTSKTNSDIYRRVFPIPQTAIDGTASGLLQQNQGYN